MAAHHRASRQDTCCRRYYHALTETEENHVEPHQHNPSNFNTKSENLSEKFNAEESTAFLTNMKDRENKENRYKWKYKPSIKKELPDGKRKVYHWFEYHKQSTFHKPSEIRMQEIPKQETQD
jgi:hypothetical protein